ncbi:MAG: tRNA (guanosine(46)-N7)-methyltransferase TrmB [Cyclobacteriaceae bacterium]
MGRNKLKRFRENAASDRVVEVGKENYQTIKGNWQSDIFKNKLPITAEMGCGNGEYTVGLAEQFKDKNCIGVDVKGSRIWRGQTTALEKEVVTNTAFLRASILDIEKFFEPNELQEIWITFPDPRPRLGDAKRRLTSPRFLKLYKKVIHPNGFLQLKTDDFPLYKFTLESIKEVGGTIINHTDDLYSSDLLKDHFGIQTTYEKRFLAEGKKINYIKFKL